MKKRIFMIIFFVCLLVFVECSQPNPEHTISSFFNEIINGDFHNTQQYFVSKENKFNEIIINNNEEIFKQVLSKLDYEILDSNINGQTATIRTKIISPDIPQIMGEVMTSALEIDSSRNDIKNIELARNDNKIIEIINSKDMPVTTNEVNINLKLVNKKWLIVLDSSFIRAITGNYINIFN